MGQVEVTVSPREGVKQFSQIDVTSYTNQTFGMFAGGGECGHHGVSGAPHRCGTGPVRQRGGYPPHVGIPFSGAKVAVSGQFFGWLAVSDRDARIVAPEAVQKAL